MKPCLIFFLLLAFCSCTHRLKLQKAIVNKVKENNEALIKGTPLHVNDIAIRVDSLLKKWPRWISKKQQSVMIIYLAELYHFQSLKNLKEYHVQTSTPKQEPDIDTTRFDFVDPAEMQTAYTQDYARQNIQTNKVSTSALNKQVEIHNRQMAEERNKIAFLSHQQFIVDSAKHEFEISKLKVDQLKKVQLAGDKVILNFPRANRKILFEMK